VDVSPAKEAAASNTDCAEAVALGHGISCWAWAWRAGIWRGACVHGPHAAAPALILRRRIVVMRCGT
jgi:hypothetical protein